jgi:hypothetical protein
MITVKSIRMVEKSIRTILIFIAGSTLEVIIVCYYYFAVFDRAPNIFNMLILTMLVIGGTAWCLWYLESRLGRFDKSVVSFYTLFVLFVIALLLLLFLWTFNPEALWQDRIN